MFELFSGYILLTMLTTILFGFLFAIGLGLAYLVIATIVFVFNEIVIKYSNWRYYRERKRIDEKSNKPPKGMEFGKKK